MHIEPDAIVFINNCTTLEFSNKNKPNVNTFLVELVKNKYYLRFDYLEESKGCFVATEVVQADSQFPYPIVSSLGVFAHGFPLSK